MIKNKDFYITYYSNNSKKLVTRKGVLTDDCRGEILTKQNKPAFHYYDKTVDGFRYATGMITKRYI